jgi:Flp pilus assembly protein TadD
MLDPNSAMSHMFLGIVLAWSDNPVEARAMLRRARELDPLFPLMFANSSVVALLAGEPREALEFATQAIAINPEFWVGYLHLGSAQLALGEYAAALQAFSDAERLSGRSNYRTASSRAYALAKLGRRDEARDVLTDLILRSATHNVPSYNIAVAYAGLDEADAAFEWLDRALATRDLDLSCSSVAHDQKLEALKPDPRFESLLKRCRIAPGLGGLE